MLMNARSSTTLSWRLMKHSAVDSFRTSGGADATGEA